MIEPPKFHTLARKDYDLRDLEILAQLAMESHIHANQQIKEAFQSVADKAGYIEFTVNYSKLQLLILEKRAALLVTQQNNPFPFDQQQLQTQRGSVTHGALNLVVGGRPPIEIAVKDKQLAFVSNKDGKKSLQRASTSTVADSHGQLQRSTVAKLKTGNSLKRHSSYVEETSSMRSWKHRSFRPSNQLTEIASSYRSASIAKLAQSKLKQEAASVNNLSTEFMDCDTFESSLVQSSESMDFVQASNRKITPPKNYTEYEGQMMELLREASKIDEEIHQKLSKGESKKRKTLKAPKQLEMMHME